MVDVLTMLSASSWVGCFGVHVCRGSDRNFRIRTNRTSFPYLSVKEFYYRTLSSALSSSHQSNMCGVFRGTAPVPMIAFTVI